MKDKKKFKINLTIPIIVIFFVLITFVAMFPQIIVRSTYTCEVTDKQVKRYEDKGDKYLIFTEDIETGKPIVFEDTDYFPLKFNSSDIYAQIKVGGKYRFHVKGVRVHILSLYENIYTVEKMP